MDIIGFLKEWMWVVNALFTLLLFIGVPAFIVIRRRRLARMTDEEQAVHRACEWLQGEMKMPSSRAVRDQLSCLFSRSSQQ